MISSPPLGAIKTASSRDKNTSIRFEEISSAAGLNYRYPLQPRPVRNVESFGSGCAALDYDGDGAMDILLVAAPHPHLYHNQGNGTFQEVTAAAEIDRYQGQWTGCAVGDYDGDGRLDILLTGFRRLALLRNKDGQHFEDVTTKAGLDPHNHNHWGSSAGFMDLDGSGHLALVLLNYVVFGPHEPQYCEMGPGVRTGCPPSRYRPEFPELWKNTGNGAFQEITASCGLKKTSTEYAAHGKALVVAFSDYDDDGQMDFYIGNDGMLADLMHNEGHLHFKNRSLEQGVALGVNGQAQASMGADWADYNRDGRLDLVNTAFSDEPYSLYQNNKFYFENVSIRTGVAEPTRKPLGFGTKFFDADNDGYPDLIFANGHVYDTVSQTDPASTYRQTLMLFHNRDGKRFDNISADVGEGFQKPILGRGLATADFDNDGRVDVLVIDYEGAPLLLHNVSVSPGHWIALDLRGTSPNRFAYGAKVTLVSGKARWTGEVSPASSYLSSSSPILHFGLGEVSHIDSIEVRWSDHKRERFMSRKVNHRIVLQEGEGIPVSSSP